MSAKTKKLKLLPSYKECFFWCLSQTVRLTLDYLQKAQGAPIREAPLNEQAQKEMMAYYYRKQEEHKVYQEYCTNRQNYWSRA